MNKLLKFSCRDHSKVDDGRTQASIFRRKLRVEGISAL